MINEYSILSELVSAPMQGGFSVRGEVFTKTEFLNLVNSYLISLERNPKHTSRDGLRCLKVTLSSSYKPLLKLKKSLIKSFRS